MIFPLRYSSAEKIQEAHPLKQGLKLVDDMEIKIPSSIQEAHPLKQGLKLNGKKLVTTGKYYSRGTSTKTRIETSE